MKRNLLIGTAVALAFGAGLATQAMVGAQSPVPPKEIIKEKPLVGAPGIAAEYWIARFRGR